MEVPLSNQLLLSTLFFVIALTVRAIFAFIETSITALRLFKLKELAHTTGRYETLFQTLEKKPHRILITTLVASSFADVTAAALATNITETVFAHFNLSSSLGFTFGIGVASMALIMFGEIIPKNIAKDRGDRLFKSMLWLLNLTYYILYPLVSLLAKFSDAVILNLYGKRILTSDEWVSSEHEIQFLIDYIHGKGLIESEKSAMLNSIFELGRTPVKEIMVPATDIISIDIATPIQDALSVFAKHQFTRLPVYQDKPDNIIGMVHQKDIFVMLSRNEGKPLKDLIRAIMFIPESVKINQLLQEFKRQQMHIAIVLNEHGSVTGLITLEDILEEIVGEITDEHEPTSQKITPLQQGGFLADGSITLEELEEFLGIIFETENSVTLGGFLTEQLQHLPKKGEQVIYKGFRFQVQQASSKRVQQVLIFEEKAFEEAQDNKPIE